MELNFKEVTQNLEYWFRENRKRDLIIDEGVLNEAIGILNELSLSPYLTVGLEAFTCCKCGKMTLYRKIDEESLPVNKGLIQHNPHCCFCGKELIEPGKFVFDEEYHVNIFEEFFFVNSGAEYNIKSIYFDRVDNEEMVVIEINDSNIPIAIPKKFGHIID